MTTLLESLNTTREETIAKHYGAAAAELKDKITTEPLKTTFHIYAGCVSKEVSAEIAHRLNVGGLTATVCKSGLVSTQYYLTVEIELPENLVHPEEIKLSENLVNPDENKQVGENVETKNINEIQM